jgi:hypothetical protein
LQAEEQRKKMAANSNSQTPLNGPNEMEDFTMFAARFPDRSTFYYNPWQHSFQAPKVYAQCTSGKPERVAALHGSIASVTIKAVGWLVEGKVCVSLKL